MKDSVIITVPSHPKYLSVVRDMTVSIGRLHGIDDSVIDNIKLAVDEACSNVIRYAYKGDTKNIIIVKYNATQKHLEVTIEDNGIKADPKLIKGRSLDDIRPGGLGIHFIQRTFDVVKFDKKKKKGNSLKLIKYLKEK